MHYSIWMYPWDLLDEGVDDVLARISQAGLNAVSVASSYHAGKFLRPHNPKGKVYFPEDGVAYFRPRPKRYEGTPIKPEAASLTANEDFFESLCSKTKGHGLNLVAWTVCLHNTRLGSQYPQFTVKNAFGDSYVYSLCPSRPEVREYVKALVCDIASNYDLHAVELESPGFLSFEHGFHHEMYGMEMRPLPAFLLSLCFCRGCIESAEAAGIDADAVREKVRELLNLYFQSDASLEKVQDGEILRWLSSEEELHGYCLHRCSSATELVRGVKGAMPSEVKLFVIPSICRPCTMSWQEGADLKALADYADAVEILGYFQETKDLCDDIVRAGEMIGDGARLHVGMRPGYPDNGSADELTEKIKAAKETGVDGFSFYNYGHIRLENLQWIKQAIEACP